MLGVVQNEKTNIWTRQNCVVPNFPEDTWSHLIIVWLSEDTWLSYDYRNILEHTFESLCSI